MALGTGKVSAIASPGMAAAATARPISGGRNVASVTGGPLEEMGFSSQIGVNDNRMWRYDDEREFDSEDEGQSQQRATPFIIRSTNGFRVDEADEATADSSTGYTFLDEILRGIGVYENNMRVISPGAVRRGSVLNFRF
jgi:hypothetical protein